MTDANDVAEKLEARHLNWGYGSDGDLDLAAAALLRSLTERVKELEEALEPFAEARLVSFGQRTAGVGPYLTSVWIQTDPNKAFQHARRARGEP